METCKFCQKPLHDYQYGANFAHKACNVRWDYLTDNGMCGKCGKPFRNHEEANMRVHEECYPDSVPYTSYGDCV